MLVLAAPSSASAMVEVTKTETNSEHTAVATCPPGTHVVSGGGLTGLTSSLGRPALNASGMSGNGWSVTGHVLGTTTYPVTAYAYCGTNDLHLTPFTGDEGTGQPRATATVACATGTAVSGGGAMTATYGYMSAYAKLANGWRTAADSRFDGGSSGTQSTATRANVNCTPERYVLTTASQSAAIAANRIVDVTAKCPPGTAVVSGGGEAGGTNASDYAYLYNSQLANIPANANGWRVDAESGPLSGTTVIAYAYCVRLPNTTITSVHVKSKKRKATFGFRGTTGEGGPRFQCSLDGKPFAACTSPKTYKKLKFGQHTFAVRALDPARRVDPSPATRSFKIKKPKKKK